ncbi:tetratricopeptide repeat protein 12 [Drosophila bipectinata]|uniref:tetratricopeptide repeat protein 12 n=1 Tax=Drosophila bipectinata TaxID=42026 RepID=UPI001C89B98C|nr:tetratricopeptide repeat protein 12 [Drosophila bipectinata]
MNTQDNPQNSQPKTDPLIYHHPQVDESFLHGPSKLDEVFECLDNIMNANKTDSSKETKKTSFSSAASNVTDTNFLVCSKPIICRSSVRRSKPKKVPLNTNQFTFMRQIDCDPEDRILAREQREVTAETFRRMGNFEYRKMRFDSAVAFYTKGLEYIKDTPVLYVNRAICYIKMREFKRSIMDCDYVINHIDEQYLRAWLYRAAAYKRLNDEPNFEASIYQAKRENYTEHEYIDDFVDKMRSLL